MNLATRLGLVVIVIGAFSGTIAVLNDGKKAAAQGSNKVRWESSKQCQECHPALYDEWYGSHHQIAFTNPEVRLLSDDFRKEECMDCHLPRPLAVTGFGKRTLPRRTHFNDGVSCITCHLAADGGILGRNHRPEVPCQPQASAQFSIASACASCHNQHGTTDQFLASHFAKQGNNCATCHMPEIERVRKDGSKRMGRKHVWDGCHNKESLQSAGKFEVTVEAGELVLSLSNVGAGHNFPTEERHRAVDMMYRFVTKEGGENKTSQWHRAYRFRQPYRDEQEPINEGNEPGENTQLTAGATKAVRIKIPAGAASAEARLWYRLTQFIGDDSPQSTLLYEQRVNLK